MSSQPSPSASRIATPPPMISGRSCRPREPASYRNLTPASAATSRNTIGDGAAGSAAVAARLAAIQPMTLVIPVRMSLDFA